MMTLHYNKLIRDNVPLRATRRGEKISYHHASDEEYWRKLKEKLQEELNEFSKLESMDALADVLEVVDAMCAFKKFDVKELDAVRENKAIENGKFVNRVILDESEYGYEKGKPPPQDI